MPPPTVLRLGRVLVDGAVMRYEPLDVETVADAGAETVLAVGYALREGSRDREEIDLVVTTELDGHTSKQESVVLLTDRPVLPDAEEGEVRHKVRFPWRGDTPVRVVVEARRHRAPWSGQGEHATTLWRHVDERTVKVR